ncbi:MAG: N-6 DNA methylase [Candidatus Hodarchaeota archaeon]
MGNTKNQTEENAFRRSYGIHLTSRDIFLNYIFPEIKEKLWKFRWIDLYAGEGNLILPVLNSIPSEKRVKFFEKHIFLFDIHPEMIDKCIKNAKNYGIPPDLASNNIKLRNNLESFPVFLKNEQLPLYHITNPPFLYLGYIRKHKETEEYLKLFEGENNGYQDLYQIAMINDLRNFIENLIYIIPSNFLFGASVSNKFRLDFLKHYKINKIFIFETKIFEYTGTNICIAFFSKKSNPKSEILKFNGVKIKKKDIQMEKSYFLKPEFNYRAGSEFNEFLEKYQASKPLTIKFYLLKKDVVNNKGSNRLEAIDANNYRNNQYEKLVLQINSKLKKIIESNILYVRTVDTGSYSGRVGLGIVSEDFNVNGIYVSGNTYRTHPIQIFFEPILTSNKQILLKDYFNFVLETFREKLDSEFLTTYKYSNAEYTRKYLGLTQTRKLIQTFPHKEMSQEIKENLVYLIREMNFEKLLEILKTCKKESN